MRTDSRHGPATPTGPPVTSRGVSRTAGTQRSISPGLRHAPGLDGLRALAVSFVVAYHLGTTSGSTLLPGGFLGVDLFFVLSGYLITSLLLVEGLQTGRLSIKQFYLRRARRLLPALFALLLTVGAIVAVWLPQQAARMRGDLLAALGYATNWWLIAQHSSYFGGEGDRPNLLTHLWSLAVEEQYYLIWPLVLLLLVAIRAKRWFFLLVAVAAVAASAAAAVILYDPFSDPSRVYYGTDTRALAPLLGAALAISLRPWRHRRRLAPAARHTADAVGITALLLLAAVAAVVHDTDEVLYGPGFLVIAALGAVVVGVAGHPGTALGELLGTQPLKWIGERSYAIYLWHWPVCVLTRPGIDIPITGWANAALRVGLSLLLAEISYWLVERPIRRYGFLAPFKATLGARGHAVRRAKAPILRTVFLSVVMVAGGAAVALQLTSAAGTAVADGPVDRGPEASLGPLLTTPSAEATRTVQPVPAGGTVAFYGDSQGMTLVINKPTDIGQYFSVLNDTIAGCGILLGKVSSRTGERRNLTTNCRNWQPEWASKVKQHKPDLAIIMIGAWELFDLTLDAGRTLDFASDAWDTNFTDALGRAIETLLGAETQVALALLPCYRPIKGSAGYWPERGEDDRTRHVNELLTEAAGRYSGVRTLEPPAQFCTDEAIAHSTAYRWDGVHYYKKGAALYFSSIVPQLLMV
jgi:peptidoglycan/LPS O-acetylase OafA/YrhL